LTWGPMIRKEVRAFNTGGGAEEGAIVVVVIVVVGMDATERGTGRRHGNPTDVGRERKHHLYSSTICCT